MHDFTYYSPTRVLFGKGAMPKLMPELQAAEIERVLILTGGQSVFASGLYDDICSRLSASGMEFHTVRGIQPNPVLSKVREAVTTAKDMRAQALLPIGGGSVFDSAKAVAAGAVSGYDAWELIAGRQSIGDALPIYGVLTLSGTSSEMNNTGVITNEVTKEKLPFVSDRLYPCVSVVDPELQYSVPLHQVRHSGFDALTHVLEAYFEGLDTTSVIIEHGEAYARGIIRCLRALPEGIFDYTMRSELSFCSAYAHSGWNSIGRARRGDFSSHRIGMSLSAMFGIPHGVTLGIIMPHWMRYCHERGLGHELFARFSVRIMEQREQGEDPAATGIRALSDFVRSLDMPLHLRDVGVKEGDIPALAENACRTLPFGAVQPMHREAVTEVLRLAF